MKKKQTLLQKVKTWWHNLPHKGFWVFQLILVLLMLIFINNQLLFFGLSLSSASILAIIERHYILKKYLLYYLGTCIILFLLNTTQIFSNHPNYLWTYIIPLVFPFGLFLMYCKYTRSFTMLLCLLCCLIPFSMQKKLGPFDSSPYHECDVGTLYFLSQPLFPLKSQEWQNKCINEMNVKYNVGG